MVDAGPAAESLRGAAWSARPPVERETAGSNPAGGARGPLVYWSMTPAFQAGKTGSIPVRVNDGPFRHAGHRLHRLCRQRVEKIPVREPFSMPCRMSRRPWDRLPRRYGQKQCNEEVPHARGCHSPGGRLTVPPRQHIALPQGGAGARSGRQCGSGEGPAHSGFSGGSSRRRRPDLAIPPEVLWTGGNAARPL